MPAVYAYLRVSTDAQDVANQKQGVSEYAAQRNWVPAFVEDTVSGRIHWRERQLGKLLDRMSKGDVLVVAEVSRLARSTVQVLELMKEATERDVHVHIVKSGMVLDGSMQAKIVATIFGLAAELERDLISARTKEALAKRKADGVVLGRPPGKAKQVKLDVRAKDIDRLLRAGISKRAIARELECSPQTLHTWLNENRPGGVPLPEKPKPARKRPTGQPQARAKAAPESVP
jgi:DNA invertase Pin-like site-specific DNA recombinase